MSLTAEQYRWLAPQGAVPVAARQPQTGAPLNRLPPDLYARRIALDRRMIAGMPATVPAQVVAEFSGGDHVMLSRLSAARTSTPNLLGDLPVVVLTRGLDASPDQEAAHAAIAGLSRNSRHTVVAGSYHEIHLSHPEAVITAILDVVNVVRERRPRSVTASPQRAGCPVPSVLDGRGQGFVRYGRAARVRLLQPLRRRVPVRVRAEAAVLAHEHLRGLLVALELPSQPVRGDVRELAAARMIDGRRVPGL